MTRHRLRCKPKIQVVCSSLQYRFVGDPQKRLDTGFNILADSEQGGKSLVPCQNFI
ncbi:MAG: hypothetical protein ACMUHX_09740 [bacterium]